MGYLWLESIFCFGGKIFPKEHVPSKAKEIDFESPPWTWILLLLDEKQRRTRGLVYSADANADANADAETVRVVQHFFFFFFSKSVLLIL